jgi:D-xylose reductase
MVAEIPLFGLGTWKIAKNVASSVVYEAILGGVRHIDCAADYGNEVEVGEGINRAISEGIVTRDDLWITSKLWNTYHLSEHVEPACRKSLKDLNIEYFDLYMIHFPISLKFVPFETRYPPEWVHDPLSANPRIELETRAPTHLTWFEMEKLVDSKLTKHIGVCNFNYQLLTDVLSYARIAPYANQIELHPYLTQNQLVEFCVSRSIRLVGYSPLGSISYVEIGGDGGLGSGVLSESVITEIATKHGRSPAQIVLRWNVQRGVSVIPKSNQAAHNVENQKIFDFELSGEEMSAVASLNRGRRFNDPGVYGAYMGQTLPIFV